MLAPSQRKSDILAPGGRPTGPTPFGYGPAHRTGNGYTRGSGRVG